MRRALRFVGMAFLAAAILLGGLFILADLYQPGADIKPGSSHSVTSCKRVMT